MSGDDELADLLRIAAGRPTQSRPDAAAIIARARQARARRRMVRAGAAAVVLVAAVAVPSVVDRKGTDAAETTAPATLATLGVRGVDAPTTVPGPGTTTTLAAPATVPPTSAPQKPTPTTGPTTTSVPTRPTSSVAPTTTAPSVPGSPGVPEVVAASGNAAAQRVTIRFSLPVAYGTSPATSCCPANYLAAMSLVVYGSDPTCAVPAGNAHDYLAGAGTDTITTDATSLVAGTTYVTVHSGFVKNALDGTPNATAVCIPIQVT
jgi:hypothetical protein